VVGQAQAAYDPAMPYCPNCGDEIAASVGSCPACEAVFGPTSAWHPLVEAPVHRDLQRIADLRAATDLRRQKREREVQPEVEEPVLLEPRGSTVLILLSVLGYLVVVASIFVQLLLIAMWVGIQFQPPGESRGWTKMGLMGLFFVSLLVIVPGTFIAIGRAIAALIGQRRFAEVASSLAFHSAAAVLPVVTIAVLGWEKS
jgi:hypothetical protein